MSRPTVLRPPKADKETLPLDRDESPAAGLGAAGLPLEQRRIVSSAGIPNWLHIEEMTAGFKNTAGCHGFILEGSEIRCYGSS
jgi:hypothetical protein